VTYNQDFYDASLRHQIDLLRFGSGVSRRVVSILDETQADLRKQVERRLGKSTALDSGGLRRLAELERAIDQTRSGAWNDVAQHWTRTAVDVALDEPAFVAGALRSILPVELDFVMPSERTLKALALARPFQGRHLKEWAESAQRSDLTRIKQQIRIGMVQGESARDIAARVFGARGAMEMTRQQADAVTRTVINHVSNAAQASFLAENSDLFSEEQLVATLDARTTLLCASLDGKRSPVGKGPKPPLHVRCRSIVVAVIDGDVVGERPFVAGTEKQFLREYAEQNGLSSVKSRDALPRGHKTAYDRFRRERMRALTGQVPARTTYHEWLGRQNHEFQDDVLGAARGKLFRDGGLTLDKFVNRAGDELTLDELRVRYPGAFRGADIPVPAPKPGPPPVKVEPLPAVRTREEALAGIGKYVDTVLVGENTDAVALEQLLDRLGAPKLFKERPLGALVTNAHTGPSWQSRTNPGPVDEIGARANGQYADRDLHGVSFLKVRREVTNPTPERLAVMRLNTEQVDRWRALSGKPALGAVAPLGLDTAQVYHPEHRDLDRIITHEFGHAVHEESVGKHEAIDRVVRERYSGAVDPGRQQFMANPDREPISKYAETNREEYFAETFAAYSFRREELRRAAPKAFKMVEDVLRLRGLL
jgi:hypothetical protein